MKFAIFASIALGVGAFLSASAEAQSIQKPTLLRCPSVDSEYVINIRIQGQSIWVDDRLQKSIFSETNIRFTSDETPEFLLTLDRTNGRLRVYNNNSKTIDSVYYCQVVDKVMF